VPVKKSDSQAARIRLLAGAAVLIGLGLSFLWSRPSDDSPGRAGTANGLAGGRRASDVVPPGIAKLRSEAMKDRHKVSTDPRHPAYDPRKLALLGKNAFDLYESEPRVESWASAIEGLLQPVVEERVKNVPGAKVVAIDCRTSSCAVTAEAPAQLDLELQLELQATPYGDHEVFKVEESEEGTFRFTIIGLMSSERRAPQIYGERLEKLRVAAEGRKAQRIARLKILREQRAREQALRARN
jgi:hypothetical protein